MEQTSSLLTSLGSLFFLLGWVMALVLVLWLPYMAWARLHGYCAMD